MFLKSIEVRGFKSFADKTELEFKQGVTAVIGPNGSGKSNISDAVRWVLGEQSVKSLRGAKMQDVIFAGTQFRKPVGVAQVSLVLDNEDKSLDIDYSQVKVTRRLYRSGESEYLINNTKCRLKDIQELFMDTGIGKEGYSLIGQGKIEAILSGHNEDRRQLFEEAAGIVKYKTRKKEAERRLKNTEENLIRINDILSTYEERIEPLRKEKEKAEKFVLLSEELKEKEVNVILSGLEKNKEEYSRNEKVFAESKKELQEADEKLQGSRLDLENWQEVLERFELESAEQKQKYYSQKNLIEKLNGEINLLKEREMNSDSAIDKGEIELKELKEKLQRFKENRSKAQEELGALMDENTSSIKEKEILEKKINEAASRVGQLNKVIEKTSSEIEKIKEELYNKKNNFVIIEKELKDLIVKKDELSQKVQNIQMSSKIKQKTKDELLLKTIDMDSNIQNMNEDIERYKRKSNGQKKDKQKNDMNIAALNREKNLFEAKKNALTNLNEQYEGYNKSVQRLMKEVHRFIPEYEKKCWVLGEVIQVEKKYELAIEISLGSAISNVITENETIAKRLITLLKDKRLGRATFLPIDIIKGKKININPDVKNMKGYIGIASELVEFNEKFTNPIMYSLGRTVIAENMDAALAIGKRTGLSYRIVTLDGQVVNPGGSLTGGSIYNKNNSIIGRKREIEELEKKSLELGERIKKAVALDESIMVNLEKIDEKILNLKDLIHEEQLEKAKVKTRINSIEGEIDSLSKEEKEIKSGLSRILDQIVGAKDEVEGFEEKNKGLAHILEISEKNVRNYMLEREQLEKLKDDVSKKLTDIRVNEAESAQKLSFIQNEIKRVAEEISSAAEKEKTLVETLESARRDKEGSFVKIEDNKKLLVQVEEDIRLADISFKADEEKKVGIKENIRLCSEKLKSEEENMILLNKNVGKFEVIIAKLESEREAVFQRLNDDLNMTIAEAEELRNTDIDVNIAAKEIRRIKDKITSLGTVNLGAIEEFKEVSEKFTFMNSQREDLTSSKEELIELIEEMTGKMRVLFKENFEVMRKNFNVTFKELFKGGSADLIIGEGDELEAGIEINVQPPGKKLQNISLMSGGEKVLSAIALLFAILKMKPTPFCILDEIEAALDDANVFRFAEFVKKFSGNIQFIVITHRKGTMSMSDVIYGVTMEEKGVSKILSIDLNKESTLELQKL